MTERGGRVGLWTTAAEGLAPAAAGELAAEIDEQGWQSMWFGEAYGREAFTAAQLFLAASARMQVGTGIASIYGRDAMAASSAGRTLNALYPGRFVMGLGVSHAPLVERTRGHDYGKPVAAMRQYLDAMDSAPHFVAGEAELPPRVLAALGPAMLRLAAERTQGAHPYLVTPEHTAFARETMGPGALLVVEQAVVIAPGTDEDEWRRRTHEHVEFYSGLPNYRNSWTRQGFSDEDYVRGGSERLKQAMVPHGLDAAVARIDEHLDAGANTVVVQVLGAGIEPPRADWALLAEAVL